MKVNFVVTNDFETFSHIVRNHLDTNQKFLRAFRDLWKQSETEWPVSLPALYRNSELITDYSERRIFI